MALASQLCQGHHLNQNYLHENKELQILPVKVERSRSCRTLPGVSVPWDAMWWLVSGVLVLQKIGLMGAGAVV